MLFKFIIINLQKAINDFEADGQYGQGDGGVAEKGVAVGVVEDGGDDEEDEVIALANVEGQIINKKFRKVKTLIFKI